MSNLGRMDAAVASWLPDDFDLLSILGNGMLIVVPGGLVTAGMPLFVNGLAVADRRVSARPPPGAMLACGACLILVHATSVLGNVDSENFSCELAETPAALSLVASLGTIALIFVSRARSLQTSKVLRLLLPLTALFDIALSRNYFINKVTGIVLIMQTCIPILKLTFTAINEVLERGIWPSPWASSDDVPEAMDGSTAIVSFKWLQALFVIMSNKDFNLQELPILSPRLSSERLSERFHSQWAKVNKSSANALLSTLFLSLKWYLLPIALSHLCVIGFTVWQPFLLLRIVENLASRETDRIHVQELCTSWAIMILGLATMRSVCEYWIDQISASVRGMLTTAIYIKAQRLSGDDLRAIDTINLIDSDAQGVGDIVILAYELIWCITQLVASVWVSFIFIGRASFLVVLIPWLTYFGATVTNKAYDETKAEWHNSVQINGALTSNALCQINTIKAMGLCEPVMRRIKRGCATRHLVSMRERRSMLWTFAYSAINWAVAPATVFAGAFFWTRSDGISAAEAIAIACTVYNASNPLMMIHRYLRRRSKSFVSISKIQAFLALEELPHPRNCPGTLGESHIGTAASGEQTFPLAIQLENVSVKALSSSDGFILKQVSLRIPQGTLAMMWGPMSCGKSTFAKLLLGETRVDSGTMYISSRAISYCSQNFWLPDGTLRQAIVGALDFVAALYDAVIRACDLDIDFAALLAGDQTIISGEGADLNDSLRQRLTLARALYAQNDVIVLDDMFSCVDPEIAGRIFDRTFGPDGMVREWNCTVILITNRLELLDSADQIYQFMNDGRIEKQDTVSTVSSSARFSSSSRGSADDSTTTTQTGTTDSTATDGTDATETENPAVPLALAREAGSQCLEPPSGAISDIPLYLHALASAGFFPIIGWLLILAITSISSFTPLISLYTCFTTSSSSSSLFFVYVGCCLFYATMNVLSGGFYFTFVLPKPMEKLHQQVLRATMGATPRYLSETHAGNLFGRLGPKSYLDLRHAGILANQFVYGLYDVTIDVMLIAYGSQHPIRLTLAILGLYCIMQIIYLQALRRLNALAAAASSVVISHTRETIAGMEHVRSFGWQANFRRRLYARMDTSQKATAHLESISRWLNIGVDAVIAVVAIVLVRDLLSGPGNHSTIGVGIALTSVLTNNLGATRYIKIIAEFVLRLSTVREMNDALMRIPREVNTATAAEPADYWPMAGAITFNSVSFTYDDTDGTTRSVLDNITVAIPSGSMVAVMGPVESGKSAFLISILRMIDCTGSINIDGINTKSVQYDLLRSRITTITQEGLALDASLRFNLYPFDDQQPSEEDMIAVLRRVHLWGRVTSNGGLDAKFSDMRFTIAQRRLLCLARAILHQSTTDTKIVLIDEAETTLSAEFVDEFDAIVENSFPGCTVFLVTHAEPLNSVDMVLQFNNGRLETILHRRADGQLVEVNAH